MTLRTLLLNNQHHQTNLNMKIVLIYYIVYTIIYFGIATGDPYWAVINMLSILLPLAYFMYAVYNNIRATKDVRDWIVMASFMTIARCIYSTACPHAPTEWIYDINKVFALFFTVWLIILIATKLYRNYSTSR